jgi:FAD binding domain
VDVEVGDVSTWPVNHMYAEKLSAGRVFCVGDAIHRHPPNNGLGSNVSVQDAYNIAWKIAYVLKGYATPALLTSYDPERQPIAKQTVDRAITSLMQWELLNKALRLEPGLPTAKAVANLANLRNNTADAAEQRRLLEEAIEIKRYEFQAHGVEMNQRYTCSNRRRWHARGRFQSGSRPVSPALFASRRACSARPLATQRQRDFHARPSWQRPVHGVNRDFWRCLGPSCHQNCFIFRSANSGQGNRPGRRRRRSLWRLVALA